MTQPVDLLIPLCTPRLLLRPWHPGDGALSAAAIAETWEQLHAWMVWADGIDHHTAALQEIHSCRMLTKLLLGEELAFVGIERATGLPVVWSGLHNVDWATRSCETGYWVRRSSGNLGFATEATNAMLRYAFSALGMHQVNIRHADGNAPSRRIIQKLGFTPDGIERQAATLPGSRVADLHRYSRSGLDGLPALSVQWGADVRLDDNELAAHLCCLETGLLQPEVRASSAAVASLLTGTFREIGSSGRLFTRADILALLAHEQATPLSLSDFGCDRLSPTLALVTYRSHRPGASGSSVTALRSSLWRVERGTWRLHFHQGTRE